MTFKKQWGYELEKTKTPGVYRMRPEGHYVSARVTHPTTGRRTEVGGPLPGAATAKDARRELDRLVDAERMKWRAAPLSKQPWIDFAVSVLEERMQQGSIESAATVDWWTGALDVFRGAWGALDVTSVSNAHYRHWLATDVARWMKTGRTTTRKRRNGQNEVKVTKVLGPAYVNGWLRILRTLSNEITERFDLPKNPFKGIKFFVEPRAHTKEEPNALAPDVLPMFVAKARELYPQHYAIILLGFVTGLRPSSLRPLRRKGPTPDLDWTTGVLLVRRSHARRQKIMNRTKQKVDGSITLPLEVVAILAEHVATLRGKAAESDLLFPNADGGFRSRTGLTKPFAAIVKALALPFRLTPKGMRRTSYDVARAAGTHDVVQRSISGHQTEDMQIHYSTARGEEQRAALEKTLAAATAGKTVGNTVGKGTTDEV